MTDEQKTPKPEDGTPDIPEEVTPEVVDETAPDAADAAAPEATEEAVVEAAAEEPAADAAPEPAPEEPVTAEGFVARELSVARANLRRTQVIGSLIVIGLSIYLISVTKIFTFNLQPDNAVQTISGLVTTQIDEHSDAFVQDVSTRVPAMMQEIPDKVMEQLPGMREQLEERFEEELTKYCESTASTISDNLSKYIADNKEQIGAVLAASKDPDAVAQLGPSIRSEVEAFLKEKPADGSPSIDEQVQESLKMLKDTESRLNYLLTAKNLSATDKKTRRAIAIIANTIEAENLKPIEMPQLNLTAEEDEAAE